MLFLVLGTTSCSFSKIQEWLQLDEAVIEQPSEEPLKQVSPISRASERVTKKPFGIYITPDTSPVQPERFSGYHTGTDFEIFEDEQETEVGIFAICEGPLVLKRSASGYGGVVVQACNINDEDVTVIYGHLRLSSITTDIDEVIEHDEKIGVLGDAYSDETDGERKHLHLGVRKGKKINLLGYVKDDKELEGWVDVSRGVVAY